MVVLDTDYLTLLKWRRPEATSALRQRLSKLGTETVTTTIISFEEQTRGWMAYKAKARTLRQEVDAYSRLQVHLESYRQIRVIGFDDTAAIEYQRLRKSRIRVGTMDLKIAALVLANDATLLSRNLADFRKVPGSRVEDWTV